MPQKLATKFFGRCQLIARVGHIAYKLCLPVEAQIHDVFYVSQLKWYHKQILQDCPELTLNWIIPTKKPEKILARRFVKRHNKAIIQVLVKRKGADNVDTT